MAAFDAITEEPPPARTWEDDDTSFGGGRKSVAPITFQLSEAATPLEVEGKIPASLLLFLFSPEAVALVQHLPCEQALLGELKVPPCTPVDPMGPPVRSEQKYPVIALGAPPYSAVAVLCDHRLPAARSFEWTRSLFNKIRPERIAILTSLPAATLRGVLRSSLSPGDCTILRLETDACKKQLSGDNADRGSSLRWREWPVLPSGTLLDGLPAAVLSYAQVRGLPGALAVTVSEPSPLPSGALKTAASALWPLFDWRPNVNEAFDQAKAVQCVLAAAKEKGGLAGTFGREVGFLEDMYV
eukprot:TRINITY_DN11480_c0_g1_i1.p1 TRINITY_DN11480_c0_g1~~TRINITY_DN11480_c0_g1_i1.p1  ORF type:complete len:299 (+),score=46.84 TRINITY_DN11480_c0_g1_i1:212-1108(+)